MLKKLSFEALQYTVHRVFVTFFVRVTVTVIGMEYLILQQYYIMENFVNNPSQPSFTQNQAQTQQRARRAGMDARSLPNGSQNLLPPRTTANPTKDTYMKGQILPTAAVG
jgi:hypothetical protein